VRAEEPAATAKASVAPLAPSILVLHKRQHTNGVAQIERAAELGFRRVNIVATLRCRIDRDGRVESFGIHERSRYAPLDDARLAWFRQHLAEVVVAAASRKMSISVVAHLNSGGPIHDWRNYFAFDPLVKYQGYSYQEAMIESLVAALAAARPTGRVELALAGEMGRSVSEHPESYVEMIERLKSDPRLPSLGLGVSLNFDHPAGERTPTANQCGGLERLFAASDFLGMSNYRWFDPPPRAEQFGEAVEAFYEQLDLPGVSSHRKLPLHFTEIAIGGGKENDVPASTPEEAAKTPWIGCSRPSASPWTTEPMRQFRVDFHRALLGFLKSPPGGVRIGGAYLWSEGSWDPLDIVDQGFYDAEIAEMIRQHNAAAVEQ
jgi:hypothetical protein